MDSDLNYHSLSLTPHLDHPKADVLDSCMLGTGAGRRAGAVPARLPRRIEDQLEVQGLAGIDDVHEPVCIKLLPEGI